MMATDRYGVEYDAIPEEIIGLWVNAIDGDPAAAGPLADWIEEHSEGRANRIDAADAIRTGHVVGALFRFSGVSPYIRTSYHAPRFFQPTIVEACDRHRRRNHIYN